MYDIVIGLVRRDAEGYYRGGVARPMWSVLLVVVDQVGLVHVSIVWRRAYVAVEEVVGARSLDTGRGKRPSVRWS